MDRRLFFAMYNFTVKRKGIKWAVTQIAVLSKSFFFLAYGAGAAFILFADPTRLVRFLPIPFFVLCYNSFLRKLIGRQRPFVRFNLQPLLAHEANGSCPSNHAASAVIISLAFWLISPCLSALLLVIAFFTGVSRVCAGVHYPSDVLLGWFIGGAVGIIGFIIL